MESFIFVVLCATLFTSGMCHALLDITYRSYMKELGGILVDLRWVAAVESVISIYYIIKKRRIEFDFALAIFIQSYVLIEVLDYQRQTYVDIVFAWILPMAYIVGKLAVSTSKSMEEANDRILKMYFSLGFGWLIAVTADVYNNFKLAAINGFQTEVWQSFWIAAAEENRTVYEIGFILTTCSIGYGLYIFRKNTIFSIIILLCNGLIQYMDKAIEGRQNRLLFMLSICIFTVLYVLDNGKSFSARKKKIFRIAICIFVASLIIIIIAFNLNYFGLHDLYEKSGWATGGGILKNERFAMDIGGFKSMLKYPLDNYRGFPDTIKPHALILEYGRVYGFTLYGLLWVFIIWNYRNAFLLFRTKTQQSWIKFLLLPALIGIYLFYAMEPSGLTYKSFWGIGLLLNGIIKGWLEIYEQKG